MEEADLVSMCGKRAPYPNYFSRARLVESHAAGARDLFIAFCFSSRTFLQTYATINLQSEDTMGNLGNDTSTCRRPPLGDADDFGAWAA